MKKLKFLCIALSFVMTMTLAVQGFAFNASAENDATSLLLGDSNLDFVVNVKDATNIQKAVAKLNTLENIAASAADVDKNETINIKDATSIQKWTANLNVPYLIGEFFEYFGEVISQGGFIMLNINPEIRIGFNADGNVISVEPANKEAEQILKDFSDYQGESCKEVVDRLIALVKDAGYLVDDIDGENKLIVIQLESGSIEPESGFIKGIRSHAEKGINDMQIKPEFIEIERKDYDEKYASGDEVSPFITLEKAIEIALAYSGVWSEDAVFEDKEYEIHRGTPYYELEFKASGFEFDVVVNALNGKVAEFEKEKDNNLKEPDNNTNLSEPESKEFITLDTAKEIALKDANLTAENVKFTDRDFDLDDGTPYFEIEFVTAEYEYDYKIHAVTGKIIERDCEQAENDEHHNRHEQVKPQETKPQPTKPEATKPAKDFIDVEDAKDAALNHAGVSKDNARFEKNELDFDDGIYKFEIEFVDGDFEYEYEVDAETGKILDFEKERKDR